MAVDVPLADVGRVIAAGGKDLGNARGPVTQTHIVDENPVLQRQLPRQQAATRRRAHRTAGNGVGEVQALPRQRIDMRRLDIVVASIAAGLGPPLIAENQHYIRLFGRHPFSL